MRPPVDLVPPRSPAAARVLSIDVLRGLTILLMILVNDPGDPQSVYAQLDHAEWNGYTTADLVFPNFLFLAGASLVFSLQGRILRARKTGTGRGEIVRGLLKRSINLLVLKLVLAAIPTLRLRRIRIFGVLFRTALCSLAGGLVLLATLSVPGLLFGATALLSLYWAALRVPVQLGSGDQLNVPYLDPESNLAAHIDRKLAHLFHGHLHSGALYNVTHDPEGLLSSAPALATLLIGSAAALAMRDPALSAATKRNRLAAAGLASLALGHGLHRVYPINKNLWTGSYVLASSGWSLLTLAVFYTMLDVGQLERRVPTLERILRPARIFGANALVAYAVSVAGQKILRTIHVREQGHSLSLRTFVYRKVFARRRTSPLRSLLFAASYAALCFVPNLLLWRRKVFVKI